MPLFTKYTLFPISTVCIIFFSACGGSTQSSSSNATPPVLISQNAFNRFDSSTYASSTCQNLPLETPLGIFVSPLGSASAAGTQTEPLDLATALSSSSPAKPGETIWLEEGVYKGEYTSKLQGTASLPIKVKPLPGKRALLVTDSLAKTPVLSIEGAWTEYYGLELLSTNTKRLTTQTGSNPSDISTNSGLNLAKVSNAKVINFIIHDNVGNGAGFWSDAYDSEMYGNIIYNNGWSGSSDRGHGHAIYAQNNTGTKKLTNNIIFFGYGTGIHAYTEGGQLNNFDIEGNTWFMTGASDPRASQRKDNCLVGGFQSVKNLLLQDNLGFSMNSRGTRLGYSDAVTGQDAVIKDNYLAENFWLVGSWDKMDISGTTVLRGVNDINAQINELGGNNFQSTPPLTGKKIVVKANAYDPRRAQIVIYNYNDDANVDVNLSSVLKIGEAYRIHSVFALFDAPMLAGVYDGKLLSIPMGSVTPPQPNGMSTAISDTDDDPHKKFGTFILTHGSCQ